MVYGKTAKGLPPLKRSKLSKKSQDKEDENKKLREANKWWNDWNCDNIGTSLNGLIQEV